MADYTASAFHKVCSKSQNPRRWFVILTCTVQACGGPEEGGWFYDVETLEAFQEFASRPDAKLAAKRCRRLARTMQRQALANHGDHLLRSLDWLDERGMDADDLPEPDGPDQFFVSIVKELPVFNHTRPRYE